MPNDKNGRFNSFLQDNDTAEDRPRAFSTAPTSSSVGGAGGSSLSSSTTVERRVGERSEAVYVQSPPKQNHIPQPNVYKEKKLDDEDPVLVAEWEYSEFVWWTKFAEELPVRYERLLEFLKIDREKYSFDLDGFYAYHHRPDPGRRCSVDKIYLPIIRSGKYHPYSSVKHKRRAARRTLERLEFLEEECRKRRVKFDYLIKIDLTLPKQVSELWNSRKVERCVRKAVRDFLRGLHEKLYPKYGSVFGAVSNHHYWATNSPLDKHRHIHLTVPNVCYNPKSDTFHGPLLGHSRCERNWGNS